MNYHPDVLAAHADFGGDLQAMQALYDRPDHIARIAELEAENERLTRLNKGLHDEVQFMRKAAKENRERHQEPVAWRYRYNGRWYVCDSESFARSGWDVTPLYTRPAEQAVTEAMVEAAERTMAAHYERPLKAWELTALHEALKTAMEAIHAKDV